MISKLHYISQGTTPEEHLENIQKACASGAELVQLRLKNVDEATVLETDPINTTPTVVPKLAAESLNS